MEFLYKSKVNKKYYLHKYVTVHARNFKRNSITATHPQYLPCQPGGTSHTLGIIGLFDKNYRELSTSPLLVSLMYW